MALIQLPYGTAFQTIDVPPSNLKGIFAPNKILPCADVPGELNLVVSQPLRSLLLSSPARHGGKVIILVDDQTRTTPAHLVLPAVLAELERAGIKGDDITILVTHGTHRQATEKEVRKKVGDRVYEGYRILQHDCQQESQQVFVGLTSRGTPLWFNREVMGANFRIGIGHIGPSPFAGYSGGGKLILPGIASLDTINANHSLVPLGFRQFASNDIPCRMDIDEAARFVPFDFLIDIVQCQDGSIAKIFAGSVDQVYQEGLVFARQVFEVPHEGLADIAITSAYPYDYDLYQGVRAIEFGDAAVKKGGAILAVAACPDGIGGDEFFSLLTAPAGDADFYLRKITRRQGKVTYNVIAYALARIRAEKQIFMLTDGIDPADLRRIGIIPVDSLQDTISQLLDRFGDSASVSVFPSGSSTIPINDSGGDPT